MSGWQSIERHRYLAEESFVHWEFHGLVREEHARMLAELIKLAGTWKGNVYALLDQRDIDGVTAEARRFFVGFLGSKPRLTVAFVNQSLAIRATMALALSAARMLGKFTLPHKVFDTPEEGLMWLRGLRS